MFNFFLLYLELETLTFVRVAQNFQSDLVLRKKVLFQNEDYAKKIIPAFGQILDKTSDAAMKTNIMYVLSDMCVRYASLVDPLIPQMAACLKVRAVWTSTITLFIFYLYSFFGLKINSP